ncbi:MAG TPA: permease [Spirochaetota bacterium]|nr:permease [Spirochaetota bacterium]HOS38912.1 permease [Spirochaetota bacterium]HPU88230.1 permease [Spirochaetota bacterium]
MKVDWKIEWKALLFIGGFFLALFYMPVGTRHFDNAVFEALYLAKWYAQEHVLLCLVPAFFIAGAIGVFVRQESVMKYLGPTANKVLAYGVGSVSGSILAVCSCTVLPLFSGIYRMGAGLGPAIAFLYSGPAINVLAIILTARVLGIEIGIARAVGAVAFSVVIGAIMHFIYRKEELEKVNAAMQLPQTETKRPLWKDIVYFASMVAILVFANWGKPAETSGFWYAMFAYKWYITAASAIVFAAALVLWFDFKLWKVVAASVPVAVLAFFFSHEPTIPFAAGAIGLAIIASTDNGEGGEWFSSTWDFAKQITPLLLGGVLVSGFLLGRPGNEGIIPSAWVSAAVGGNSLAANFFAAVVGAFMYFATLTEVPIVQGLIGSGMGAGPALALLLAGPALSLPNMLVIRNYIGTQKTIVFCSLVIIMATISGYIFGMFF